MLKRLLAFLVGVGLILFVVWLGFQTRNHESLIVWFGLASAILVPIGLAAIGYALTAGNRQALERLSKVPEIERLIAAAETQEEKIARLELERARLLEVVEYEARRESLTKRKESLQEDATRLLSELEAIDEEMQSLNVQTGPASEEITRLKARIRARQQGDIVFRIGSRHFVLRRETLIDLPYGIVLFDYLKLATRMNKNIERLLKRDRQS